jgi:hypothetical protein
VSSASTRPVIRLSPVRAIERARLETRVTGWSWARAKRAVPKAGSPSPTTTRSPSRVESRVPVSAPSANARVRRWALGPSSSRKAAVVNSFWFDAGTRRSFASLPYSAPSELASTSKTKAPLAPPASAIASASSPRSSEAESARCEASSVPGLATGVLPPSPPAAVAGAAVARRASTRDSERRRAVTKRAG